MADEHNAEWYENTFKRMIYWVGGVLIAGTAITYVIDKWGVAEKYGLLTAVIFGLTVATIKAATVIVIFMHTGIVCIVVYITLEIIILKIVLNCVLEVV